jgi:hypothetical protein
MSMGVLILVQGGGRRHLPHNGAVIASISVEGTQAESPVGHKEH